MLELIIDKAFFENFFIIDKESDYRKDVDKFFKKVKHFTLITNYASIEEMQKEGNPLLDYFLERVPLLKFVPELANELKAQSYYQSGSPFKLFFVEAIDDLYEDLKQKFGYAYITTSNIDNEWKVFYSEREDLKLTVSKSNDLDADDKFDKWQKMQNYQHPFNSILLFDNYILAEKTNRSGTLKYGLNQNLKPLLKHLLQNIQNEIPLEIIIFSQDVFKFDCNQANHLVVIHHELTSFIRQNFPLLTFKINLVKYEKSLGYSNSRIEPEHDRFLISNYFYFEIGGGFDVFDRQGRINRRTTFQGSFIFHSKNVNNVISALSNLKKYAPLATEFYPSKQNRLLTFN